MIACDGLAGERQQRLQRCRDARAFSSMHPRRARRMS